MEVHCKLKRTTFDVLKDLVPPRVRERFGLWLTLPDGVSCERLIDRHIVLPVKTARLARQEFDTCTNRITLVSGERAELARRALC
jgi:hypothetical protein